jgi:hypothetical protein
MYAETDTPLEVMLPEVALEIPGVAWTFWTMASPSEEELAIALAAASRSRP